MDHPILGTPELGHIGSASRPKSTCVVKSAGDACLLASEGYLGGSFSEPLFAFTDFGDTLLLSTGLTAIMLESSGSGRRPPDFLSDDFNDRRS